MERIRILAGALLALICLSAAADSSSLSWTWRNPLPSPDAFTVITSGGGIYVTAGQDGVIYHSTDGINWVQAKRSPLGMGGQYLDAIYANGRFLLSGTDTAGAPHVSTSSDGVTWADSKLDFDADPLYPRLQLAFGNGIYLVMGENGEATSSDAVTWTLHGMSFANASFNNPILFANGVFVVEGDPPSGPAKYSGTIFFSSDGVNWTASSVDTQGNLAADGTTFIMLNYDGTAVRVYTSSDGNHWSKKTATGDAPQDLLEVQWDGTRFLGLGYLPVSSTPNASYSSPDGIAWTLLSSSLSADIPVVGPHSFTTVGGTYTSVASGALQIAQSTDFANWSTVFSGSSGPTFDLADITYGGGHFVAVGNTANGLPAIMESTDGSAWTAALSSGAPSDLTTVAFGKGLYVAAGSGAWFSSPDAVTWTALTPHPQAVHTDVVYGNGMFLAFAGGTTVSSTDGKTWKTGVKAPAATLAYDGTRFVSVGSDPHLTGKAPVYTSCDGTNWSHSADIGVAKGDSFSRVRPTSRGLVAMGTQACISTNPHACLGPVPPVIATSEDSSNWTAHELGGDVSSDSFIDVTFAGSNYYAIAGLGDGGDPADSAGLLYTSSDAATWTPLSGAPFNTFDAGATFNALATDGNHLVAVGPGGDIISASVAGDVLPTSGAACTALPTVSSSGKGSLDLITLMGLLGLLLLRRRAGAF